MRGIWGIIAYTLVVLIGIVMIMQYNYNQRRSNEKNGTDQND